MATKAQTATAAYLKPILEAATLLKLKPYPATVEQLTGLLDKLSHGFPADVLEPIHALAILGSSTTGTVEELEILEKVWPGFSGEARFTLTPTTLTWKWSSKHTGRYATITVPFPTILPMQVTVKRFCDMDDLANHGEGCQVANGDGDGDCNCESFVEQTVSAIVTEWDEKTEAALAVWLERAVDQQVEPVTFAAAAAKGE